MGVLLIHYYCYTEIVALGVFHFECFTLSVALGVFHFDCCYNCYNGSVSLLICTGSVALDVFHWESSTQCVVLVVLLLQYWVVS